VASGLDQGGGPRGAGGHSVAIERWWPGGGPRVVGRRWLGDGGQEAALGWPGDGGGLVEGGDDPQVAERQLPGAGRGGTWRLTEEEATLVAG
jgi:hypothetical protein